MTQDVVGSAPDPTEGRGPVPVTGAGSGIGKARAPDRRTQVGTTT